MIILPSAFGFTSGWFGPMPPIAILSPLGGLSARAGLLIPERAGLSVGSTWSVASFAAIMKANSSLSVSAAMATNILALMAASERLAAVGSFGGVLSHTALMDTTLLSGSGGFSIDVGTARPFGTLLNGLGGLSNISQLWMVSTAKLLPAAGFGITGNLIELIKAPLVGAGSLGGDTGHVIGDSMRAAVTMAAALTATLTSGLAAGSNLSGAGAVSLPTLAEQEAMLALFAGAGNKPPTRLDQIQFLSTLATLPFLVKRLRWHFATIKMLVVSSRHRNGSLIRRPGLTRPQPDLGHGHTILL